MDGAKVLGDILAAKAVAAGRAPNQEAVFVGEGHGKAVELELADHVIALLFQESRNPGPPSQHIILGEGVGQAEHGPGVLDGRKGRKGLGADALAGRVGGDELRVLLFEGA